MVRSFDQIEKILENVDNLPTLPSVIANLLRVINSNDVSLRKIAELVNSDPALTMNILKLANSAYYSMRIHINTLKMALVVLGTREIINLILGISLTKIVKFDDEEKSIGFAPKQFWEHSSNVAHISSFLAEKFQMNLAGEEFTAGLIHDIGKLILVKYFTSEYEKVILKKKAQKANYTDLERKIVGATHAQLGGWIAEQWKLPDKLVHSILFHHDYSKVQKDKDFVALISLSNLIVNTYKDVQNDEEKTSIITNSDQFKILAKHYKSLDFNKLDKGIREQIESSNDFIRNILKQ